MHSRKPAAACGSTRTSGRPASRLEHSYRPLLPSQEGIGNCQPRAAVSAGDLLGVAGSSGCSTAPHLHFELGDAANRVVDPFRNGLWAAPPAYNPTITLMDWVTGAGGMTLQQIKDPSPNLTSIPHGSVLGVGVSMAGGGAGDVIRLVITGSNGRDLLRQSSDVHHCLPALLLVLEPPALAESGGVDRFLLCEWGTGPERDGDRRIRMPGQH